MLSRRVAAVVVGVVVVRVVVASGVSVAAVVASGVSVAAAGEVVPVLDSGRVARSRRGSEG